MPNRAAYSSARLAVSDAKEYLEKAVEYLLPDDHAVMARVILDREAHNLADLEEMLRRLAE
jgi:hypothetical protein